MKTYIPFYLLIVIFLASCGAAPQPVILISEPTLPPETTATTEIEQPTPVALPTDLKVSSLTPLFTAQVEDRSIELSSLTLGKERLSIEFRVAGYEYLNGACPISTVTVADDTGNTYESIQPQNFDLIPQTNSMICVFRPDLNGYVALISYDFTKMRPYDEPNFLSIQLALGGFMIYPEDGDPYFLPQLEPVLIQNQPIGKQGFGYISANSHTSNGVEISDLAVSFSPSLAIASFCVSDPTVDGYFSVDPRLIIGEKTLDRLTEIFFYGNALDTISGSDGKQCFQKIYAIDQFNDPTVTAQPIGMFFDALAIDNSENITPELCEKTRNELQTRYPELEFICHINTTDGGYGFGLEITDPPTGMTIDETYTLINAKLNPEISLDIKFEDLILLFD